MRLGIPTAHQYVKGLLSDHSGVDLGVNINATPGNNWQGHITIRVPEERRAEFLAAANKHGYEKPTEYVRAVVSEASGVEILAPTVQTPQKPVREVPEEEGPEETEQQESDKGIRHRLAELLKQQRDRKKAVALKLLYDNTCMFCGTRLQVAKDRFYSEAAHIRGVGKPDNGPDKKSNVLVLCPNHHIQFDRGVLRLHKVNGHYQIKSETSADPLHEKNITLKHSIDEGCVKYHHERFK